ncbi:Uncharacterised protein [Mycobacteroides abscessus subsp. massiliense]|uniref:hypothetical protein n=1 Tax=Mycobacteroides abscessus TaxID=36809 RepID=UPI0009A8A0DF|nr:hypothetical protein [Mycobacteroides abscessus]SLC05350.1 Uncharacterised protein [Mycobacteroides abscessus subsp. massiliense]
MNARNPEQNVIDAIGELVDEQLSGYSQRSGYDHNVNQDKCAVCGREWHGLALGGCPGPYGTAEQKGPYRSTANPSYGQRRNHQPPGIFQTSSPTMFQVDVVPEVDVVPPDPTQEEIAALIERPVDRLALLAGLPTFRWSVAEGMPEPEPVVLPIIEVETSSMYDQRRDLVIVRITEQRAGLTHQRLIPVPAETLCMHRFCAQRIPMEFVPANGWLQMARWDEWQMLTLALNGFEGRPDRLIRMAIPGMRPVRRGRW